MARGLACRLVRITVIAGATTLVTGPMVPSLRWDRRTLRPIDEEIVELVTEDPEDLVAMEVQEADLMAATAEVNLMTHGGTTKGAEKVGKETAKEAQEVVAQEAVDLAVEAALVGGPMVQDGGAMARMMTLSGRP